MNTHASFIFKLIALAVIACVPLSGESFYIEIIGKVLVMAIFAMSLDLLQGVTGLVSLGHAAYFGLAGYVLAFVTPQGEAVSLWWTLPLAVLGIKKQFDAWAPGHHTGTFRGNQLAMATGLTTLKILKDDKIADKVAAQGEWLKGKLADLQKRYPVIGQVRGLGLMIGLEIVKPNEAQDHMGCYPADGELSALLQKKCFEAGLILERGGRHGCVLRLLPSLLISDAELDVFLDKFEQALLAAGVPHRRCAAGQRGDHRGDHHRQVIDHADGGDDRIQREDDVDQDDLHDHRAEGGLHGAGGFAFFAFHELMDFLGALPDEEQAAAEKDQVASGEASAHHGDQGFGHAGHPRERRQQRDAHEHGKEQAEPAGEGALFPRQLVHQDGDEDDVVDTQHQLEGGEGEEGNQQLRVGQEFHGFSVRCCGSVGPPGRGTERMVARNADGLMRRCVSGGWRRRASSAACAPPAWAGRCRGPAPDCNPA